jgi:GNAT superfamily N-acetyltransferase
VIAQVRRHRPETSPISPRAARLSVEGIEDMSLMMKFHLDTQCDNPEPGRFISIYEGDILADEESIGNGYDIDSDEPDIKVGEIHMYLVDYARILNERESLFDVMDDVSYETMSCYEALIDEDTDWKEEVEDLVGEDTLDLHNILLINRLELDASFRGRGIGKQVVEEIILRFESTCAVIACKPFPLQYEGRETPKTQAERKTSQYKQTRREAFAKVTGFWRGLGFRKLPSSDHYVWVKKPARRRRSQTRD